MTESNRYKLWRWQMFCTLPATVHRETKARLKNIGVQCPRMSCRDEMFIPREKRTQEIT